MSRVDCKELKRGLWLARFYDGVTVWAAVGATQLRAIVALDELVGRTIRREAKQGLVASGG